MTIDIIASIFIGIGVLCCVAAMIGIYRFDYVLTRIHAAAIVDTLGTLCIFIGMILLKGFGRASAKILLILVFQWVTSPVSTHRISRVEILTNPKMDGHCEVRE